jgi:hypothetical protein
MPKTHNTNFLIQMYCALLGFDAVPEEHALHLQSRIIFLFTHKHVYFIQFQKIPE